MIRRCSYCGKDMGEKAPYNDTSVTHGICKECLILEYKKLEKYSDRRRYNVR